MELNSSPDSAKKTALENLSKEDLLEKCKSLLIIAQKAKQAKDTLQEENNELKSRRANDATNEIIEKLTQEKLEHVIAFEDLKKQNTIINNKLQKCLQELCQCEQKSNELDNENISLKRQVRRLTEENEQLLVHLETQEKETGECKRLGLEQQSQLLALESLRINLEEKDKSILILSEELKSKMKELENIKQSLKAISENDSKEVDETLERMREKLKSYHSKIVKFAGSVKVLKEDKNEVLSLFKIYTDQVEEWKAKLSISSQQLVQYLSKLEAENRTLKEANIQLEAHKTDDEKSEQIEEIQRFRVENKKLTDEIKSLLELQNDYKDQIEILLIEKESINKDMSDAVEKHQTEIRAFDAQNIKDSLEIQSTKEENEKICIEYRKVISKLEETLDANSREIETLKSANQTLQLDFDYYKSTEKEFSKKTSEEIIKLVQENAELTRQLLREPRDVSMLTVEVQTEGEEYVASLHLENEALQKEIEHFKSTERQFADKSGEEITKLVQKNNELNEKLQKFEEIITQTSETQTEETKQSEETVTSMKRENTELLGEMNEMNQALKERGETISKLEAHCEEVMKKLQVYEAQANKKEEIVKKLQEELNNMPTNDLIALKDKEIQQMKTEMENLKCGNVTEVSYADSESMSTSTISRGDEINRLKDLEGSWEERYGKLRNFALKLKAKIRELTNELSQEHNEKNDCLIKLATLTKTVSTLQAQCDKVEDELDESKNLGKKYLAQLDALNIDVINDKQQITEKEQQIVSLRKDIEELREEKIKTDQWKKQISAKVQTLRKEQEAAKILKDDCDKKIAKLKAELGAKEHALQEESTCHKQTRSNLEQSNNEIKKNSVLNLEMQDYERSVKELSQKLEKKQEQIDKLKSQVEVHKNTSAAVREQNRILEERSKEVENELELARSEIMGYRKQISEFEEIINQKDDKIHSVNHLLETVRAENEELATELSKIVAEHQRSSTNLKNEKEFLKSQSFGLQQSLRETQDMLKLKEEELQKIRSDYENYKVRAQSVLRQNNSRDVGLEEKLNEEVTNLKAQCQRLESGLIECSNHVEKLKEENEDLLHEKANVSEKLLEAVSEAEDLKSLFDQLSSKHQQAVIEHSETVRSLKVHAETLGQCLRQQLSEQEVRHNREIIELQSKIEKAPSPTEIPFPPLSTMHREEGEGSENTEPVLKPSMYPVPLERLLGSDTEEVAYMKKQLSEEESKVAHLTALLADTEQDLAKHAQMNKLLKEEIRRQQRSVEREQHAENLEYLKNVVFKFITLHSGDERTRLVPVLNTILKLSPEETQKLNIVARGDPGIKSWSNYLPLWSSTSKPQ